MKMSNSVYDVLKFIAQIVLPALATLWAALGKIWGWPLVTEITATICAVDTFLGALLGINSMQYAKQEKQPPDEKKHKLYIILIILKILRTRASEIFRGLFFL